MVCIPEFLKCQWVGGNTWPGGKEAEGSWTGRWVREKVHRFPSSMSKWAQHPQTHALRKTQSLGKGAKKKKPRARAWRHFEIADILSGWWWERELVLWIQTSSLVMQIPEVLHRGLKLLLWQRLGYGHQYMHTQEWGSHIQHRLAVMLTVSLFTSDVWPPCKLFLFIVTVICSWLLTVKGNK